MVALNFVSAQAAFDAVLEYKVRFVDVFVANPDTDQYAGPAPPSTARGLAINTRVRCQKEAQQY